MAEDAKFSPEQIEKLSQFQNLTGIDDMERGRNILEFHNWNLDVATQITLNVREGTPFSDVEKDVELSPEQIVVLADFQVKTGIDDMERCLNVLDSHNWDLEIATRVALNLHGDTPSSDMSEGAEQLTSDQIDKLLAFQDLTGIHEIEGCRNILESHNWDLDVATQVIQNMRKYIPSVSDLAADEHTPEQIVALSEFQDLTGIDDIERCRYILESYNWDLGVATQLTLNVREDEAVFAPSVLDEPYNETLLADRMKERKLRQEQELKVRQKMKERNIVLKELCSNEKAKEEIPESIMKLHAMVKEEPPLNSPNTIRLIIKFPSGTRVERRFSKDDSMKYLCYFIYSFIIRHNECLDDLEIFTIYPRKVVPCEPTYDIPEPPTFEEFGLENLETVFVQSLTFDSNF